MYVDANNLYGLAMSQSLPISDYKWGEVENFNLDTMNDNENKGYFVECDLEYPKELHENHKDYPLAPETMKITSDMLSAWAKTQKETLNIKGANVQKLCQTFLDKEKYICHSKNLEFYIKQGLKVKKIHRVLSFTQKPWLKQYIDLNTELPLYQVSPFGF